jgi:hypothetical protein
MRAFPSSVNKSLVDRNFVIAPSEKNSRQIVLSSNLLRKICYGTLDRNLSKISTISASVRLGGMLTRKHDRSGTQSTTSKWAKKKPTILLFVG